LSSIEIKYILIDIVAFEYILFPMWKKTEEKGFTHRQISTTIILPLLGYGKNLLPDAEAHNLRLSQLLKPKTMEVLASTL